MLLCYNRIHMPKKNQKGKLNPNWRGGMPKCSVCKKGLKVKSAKTCIKHRPKRGRKKILTQSGYVKIYIPAHKNSDKNGYIREHRLIMEKKIGRFLKRSEHVHHINHIRTDNRIENLMIMSPSEHSKLHNTGFKQSKETRINMSIARKKYLREKL